MKEVLVAALDLINADEEFGVPKLSIELHAPNSSLRLEISSPHTKKFRLDSQEAQKLCFTADSGLFTPCH